MQRTFLTILTALTIATALLSGCTAPTTGELTPTSVPQESTSTAAHTAVSTTQPAETGPITVTDALGRQVELPALPQRIVVPGKAAWMIGHALYMFPDVSGRVVALEQRGKSVSTFLPLLDPTFLDKPHLEQGAAPEQIAGLRPDAILLKSYLANQLGTPLEKLGLPVIAVDLETPSTFFRDIATMGQLLGNQERAQEITDYYQAKLDYIAAGLEGLKDSDRPTVLMLQYKPQGEDIALQIPSISYMQTIQVETSGGNPIWAEAAEAGGWTTVNFEQIAAWDADIIFVIAFRADAGQVVTHLKSDPMWQALQAVQNEEIYAFPEDLYGWDLPDPRWILGTLWVAGKTHPDRFSDLNMQDEIYEFFGAMYGMDNTAVDQNIMPALTGDVP